MNIRKKFNRLAAGLGVAFAMGLTTGCSSGALAHNPANPSANPSANPIIPPGSTPDYLPLIYERIINSGSNINARATSNVHSPIARITDIPANDWLQRLRNMSPGDAQEEIRGCFQSFCEHKYPLLTENEKFIARIVVIEAMFHDGLNDEEFRTYSEFVSRFQPDQNFHQRDDALIERITDQIINSPEYVALKQRLVPSTQITRTNAVEQYNIRKNFIDMVTHETRSAYDMDGVTTHLDNFPRRLSSAAAYALSRAHSPELPTNRGLIFNYAAANAHSIESLLEISAHEARHTMDYDDLDRVHRREITTSDPHFKHVAVINLNQNLYISLCTNNTHAQYSCPEQFEWYKNQYVERSAQDFARKLVDKFRAKIRALDSINKDLYNTSSRETPSLQGVRRLEPQKLELPS